MMHSGYLLLTIAVTLMAANFLGAAFTIKRLRSARQGDAKRWDPFMAEMSNPPKDNPRLRKLLARKPSWKA